MNEKERMLAGLMYDATDKELEKERFAAEKFLHSLYIILRLRL